MSFKVYCDVCDALIPGSPDRVRRRLGDVMIEVQVRYKATWNAGHICENCVIRVIHEGEIVANTDRDAVDRYVADNEQLR